MSEPIQMKPRDHYFTFGWWSEPWGEKMIYVVDGTLKYDDRGTRFPESLPPTHVEVMIRGRDEGQARIFSSRRVEDV